MAKKDATAAATPFQRSVFARLLQIPAGRVTTYGALARSLGCGSARAVGQALRCNRDAPRIPCHRVVRSDLQPGGYFGDASLRGVSRKVELLKAEGVMFLPDGRVAADCVVDFCLLPKSNNHL